MNGLLFTGLNGNNDENCSTTLQFHLELYKKEKKGGGKMNRLCFIDFMPYMLDDRTINSCTTLQTHLAWLDHMRILIYTGMERKYICFLIIYA